MKPFDVCIAPYAHLPLVNIDTDMIIPKQFLKTLLRSGLGQYLFFDMRYHDDGTEKSDFILNEATYKKGCILIAGQNFGCGSSREHAPWALHDYGIRCVIAPSFADIFYNNCFKNGMLPIILDEQKIKEILDKASESGVQNLKVDLAAQQISLVNYEDTCWQFSIEESRKKALLEGLDDIANTLMQSRNIDAFEARAQQERPWLFS